MKPYVLSSDQHAHNWSQFSQVGADGINTRLAAILAEIERSADTLLKAGGTHMFLGGDLFHVRGRIEPEVLNPTMDLFKRICAKGIKVHAIAGNHDLSGKFSSKLGNAMQALDEIEGFMAITTPTLVKMTENGQPTTEVMMIPWIEDLNDLRSVCKSHAGVDRDLIIHAPLNGVIKGLPDHGLDPVEVAAWGYKRVFIGHYHSHQEPVPGVYSIGATAHQTWSDPDTIAGFIVVDETSIQHYETAAPQFVNVDDGQFDANYVFGNYCRLRLKDADEQTIKDLRVNLIASGALGIVDHSSKKREVRRGAASTSGNVTLEVSVATFVMKTQDTKLDRRIIAREALDILTEARTVGADE